MLFRLGVKKSRQEFFNFDEELEKFINGLRDRITRMVVVKGIRRSGKSSLIHVGLSEVKLPSIVIDIRVSGLGVQKELYNIMQSEISKFMSRVSRLGYLRDLLSRISGIRVGPLGITFERPRLSILTEVLKALNSWAEDVGTTIVLVFDEVQELRFIRGFTNILAHIYDYLDNIKLVLAGSQVGLLEKLIGVKNSSSPLYGRAFLEITMGRLDIDKSKQFLVTGFRELGIEPCLSCIDEAVYRVDGVIGWLTHYGYYASMYGHREGLRRTIEEASRIISQELENFLSLRTQARNRYIFILKYLQEPRTWSEIERALSIYIGRRIHPQQLSNYLHELMDYSLIVKDGKYYKLSDPLLSEALRTLK